MFLQASASSHVSDRLAQPTPRRCNRRTAQQAFSGLLFVSAIVGSVFEMFVYAARCFLHKTLSTA